jgi:hypothetical protein
MGLRLFEHTRAICEASGIPHVIENVRCAQKFVGRANGRCGSFYLWGDAVPPLMPQGITKGMQLRGDIKGWSGMSLEERRAARRTEFMVEYKSGPKQKKECTAKAATIPAELANCVASYAERLIEVAV